MSVNCFVRSGRKGLRDNHRRLMVLGVILLMFPVLGNIARAQHLSWAKRAGGAIDPYNRATDSGNGIAVDGSNNSYVTGVFRDTATFGEGPNQITLTASANWDYDIFVAKYAPDGTLAWAKRAGGTGYDSGIGIAVDSSGNSYVLGSEYYPFVSKYDNDGNLVWAKQMVGAIGRGISVDGSGNSYVTGTFYPTATFGEVPIQITLTGTSPPNLFVVKYAPDGSLVWAKQAKAAGNGISVDGSGNSYVTGTFISTATFGEDPDQITLTSTLNRNLFVVQYAPDGRPVWAKQAGGASSVGIAVDGGGNSHVTGEFSGTAIFGMGETNETTITSAGGTDIFVAKYGIDGSLVWARHAGGASYDQGRGVTADSRGNSYVTGFFNVNATFGAGEPNATLLTSSGAMDIFVAKYGIDGSLIWAKRAGGASIFPQEQGNGIAVDSSGNSYVTGIFQGTATFGETPNQITITSAGGMDIFVAKYLAGGGETPTGPNVTVTPVDPNPVVSGTSVQVTFSEVTVAGTTYVASSQDGTPPPTGFSLGDPPVYFEITTSPETVFPPPITVCISYTEISFTDESKLRLYHQTGGVLEDVTTTLDTAKNIICGESASLSPFAILEATYKFVGFFPPVRTGPAEVNLAKAGSAIPMKWQLRAEGGGFVSALSAVTGIRYQQKKNCSDSTLLNDLVLVNSSGSSGLLYDFSSNQYIYTWKTEKNMARKCYRLDVEFTNREKHSADFQMW